MVHGGAIIDCGEASHRHTRGKERTSFVCHDPLPQVLVGPRLSLWRGITATKQLNKLKMIASTKDCSPSKLAENGDAADNKYEARHSSLLHGDASA